MERFSLKYWLLLSGCFATVAIGTYSFVIGRWSVGCLMIIVLAVLTVWLCMLVNGLIDRISAFSKALEMKDYTVSFPQCKDSRLNHMSSTMNHIIASYRDNMFALETSKLYYDRILRFISHEMRNGLTPIASLSSNIAQHPENYNKESLAEAMELISDQSLGLKKFLDSYHNLLHLPKPETQEVNLVKFFDTIRTDYDSSIVRFSVSQGMTVDVDEGLFRQVIVNLLNNAVYAVQNKENPRVEITASYSEGRPFISVADNGCGISDDDMQYLFQPFFTTKLGGSGIGLCLSKQIIRLHNGDITVHSALGRGTTFTINLNLKN